MAQLFVAAAAVAVGALTITVALTAHAELLLLLLLPPLLLADLLSDCRYGRMTYS